MFEIYACDMRNLDFGDKGCQNLNPSGRPSTVLFQYANWMITLTAKAKYSVDQVEIFACVVWLLVFSSLLLNMMLPSKCSR